MEQQEIEKNEKNKERYENKNEEKPKEKEIKIEKPKQENQIIQNPFQTKTFHIINEENNNNNINSEGGKVRRKRRSKSEIKGRDFKCPNCGKSYLSAPALFNHRKSKHNYVQEGERKGRGRPRKDPLLSNSINQNKKKYETFFDNDLRKIKVNNDNEVINLDTLKQNLSDVFRQCKDIIFPNIANVENYSFYIFLNENWNKEKLDGYEECRSSIKNDNIIQYPPLDGVFYYYLKEVISKTNKEYFSFREYINKAKNNLIDQNYVTEKKKLYTQIYSAESIPDMCNDYFIDFMEPNNYFGLHSNELIELIQHFCYWLVTKNYTQSNLTLI